MQNMRMISFTLDQVVFLSYRNGTEPNGPAKLRNERRWRGGRRHHSTSQLSQLDSEDSPGVAASQARSQTADPAALQHEPLEALIRPCSQDRVAARASARTQSRRRAEQHGGVLNHDGDEVPQSPQQEEASAARFAESVLSANALAQVWRRRVGKGEEAAAAVS
jgi:hypothetical protein